MRQLKDYVVHVNSIVKFKEHLLTHVATSSFISGTTVEDVKVNITKVLSYSELGATISIARANAEQLAYFVDCDECDVIGEAEEQFINSLTDINFYTETNKELYYSVYSISPILYTDEAGVSCETHHLKFMVCCRVNLLDTYSHIINYDYVATITYIIK